MPSQESHRWAVDSIEEGVARIEEDGGRMISVPVALLPAGTEVGQVLRATRPPGAARGVAGLSIVLDAAGTEAARRASKAVVEEASAESKARDPGGDVAL